MSDVVMSDDEEEAEVVVCLRMLRSFLGSRDALWRRSGEELRGLLGEWEQVARLAAVAVLEVAAEAERRGVPTDDGCPSLAAFLRQALRLSPAEAAERGRLVRALCPSANPNADGAGEPPLPATAAVMRTGEVSSAHANVIERTIAELPDTLAPEVVRDAEVLLAEQARQLDPRQLAIVARHLRARLDQDGLLREEQDAVASRELHLSQDRRGRTVLRGILDAEAGAALQGAIESLAAPRPATDGERDPRTPARRRADALVELVTLATSGGDLRTRGGERPHLTVTIGLDQLRAGAGSGELEWAGPITARSARRLACDSGVVPVVLGSRSEPLDVGRLSYTVPRPMHRALVARDGGCAFPGCDRPAPWCEAHHVRHWADGGETALDNLVLLCGHHHRVVHHDGWEVRISASRPEFLPPPWIDPTRRPRRGVSRPDLARLGAAS